MHRDVLGKRPADVVCDRCDASFVVYVNTRHDELDQVVVCERASGHLNELVVVGALVGVVQNRQVAQQPGDGFLVAKAGELVGIEVVVAVWGIVQLAVVAVVVVVEQDFEWSIVAVVGVMWLVERAAKC